MTDIQKKEIIRNIKGSLNMLHPSEAIAILEKLSKDYRQSNSIRISRLLPVKLIEMERPDLIDIK
jgi:flagellar motor switch protein FliG